MYYENNFGKKVHRRFVTLAIIDADLIVDGIYETYAEAVGSIMMGLWDFADSYKDDGDEFSISLPQASDLDGSELIEVYYKKRDWTHGEKESRYILFFEENERKGGE